MAGFLQFFYDDFEDGDIADGVPVSWSPGLWHGDPPEVINGDLHILNSHLGSLLPPVNGRGAWLSYDDHTIRSQMRISQVGGEETTVGIVARVDFEGGYGAGIKPDGELSLFEFGDPNSFGPIELQTVRNPVTSDIFMQLDFEGEQIALTVWEAGTTKPIQPQFSRTDDSKSRGIPELRIHGGGKPASAIFR